MKFLALLAALMFAGVVSADSHTTGTPAADPHAKAADHKDHGKKEEKKEEKKEAKKK